MDLNNPAAAQPDASQLNAAAPAANVGTLAAPANAEALSLAELNQLLGRKFDSKESALKSIKDTFNFATTRVADITSKVDESTKTELKRLSDTVEAQNKELFYTQNPQYAPHRKLIDSLGKVPGEVVNSDVFKDTFKTLQAHGETVKLKTVLESNPRLAASRDSMTKAADLKKANNGFVTPEVENLVTGAVLDAYGLR
jgi:uncharacterized protein YbjQ (UPF0145 family)